MEWVKQEHQEQYQALSKKDKAKFDSIAKEHPDWKSNQVFSKYKIDNEIDKAIEGGGTNVDPSNPIFLKEILKKVQEFFAGIGDSFVQVIDNAINRLENLIKRGVDKVKDVLSYIF